MYRDRGTDEDADMIEERRCKFGPKTSVSRPVYSISSRVAAISRTDCCPYLPGVADVEPLRCLVVAGLPSL